MDILSGLSTQMSIGSPEFGTQKAAMTTVVQWTKILEFVHSRLRNTARSVSEYAKGTPPMKALRAYIDELFGHSKVSSREVVQIMSDR